MHFQFPADLYIIYADLLNDQEIYADVMNHQARMNPSMEMFRTISVKVLVRLILIHELSCYPNVPLSNVCD